MAAAVVLLGSARVDLSDLAHLVVVVLPLDLAALVALLLPDLAHVVVEAAQLLQERHRARRHDRHHRRRQYS